VHELISGFQFSKATANKISIETGSSMRKKERHGKHNPTHDNSEAVDDSPTKMEKSPLEIRATA
jgi:hypothetical protein